MRLINARTIELEEFVGQNIPRYAILSHTWGKDEVTFQDMQTPTVTEKLGYAKIKHSCERALQDSLGYVWVDTCCIDKTSSAELSEAINSMMAWYAQSKICYAHLADVPPITDQGLDKAAFSRSRWFTRGWTLQELIAPAELVFLAQDWSDLYEREILAGLISDITGIHHSFLDWRLDNSMLGFRLKSTSIAERMSWASNRETTRTEDMAYSLLGLLQVNMPLLYGEGSAAFRRLQEEIIKYSDDQSLFAWSFRGPEHDLNHKRPWSISQSLLEKIVFIFKDYETPPESSGAMRIDISDISEILAESPAAFRGCGDIVPCDVKKPTPPFSMTNKGLSIELPLLELSDGYFALLQCQTKTDPTKLIALPLLKIDDTYCRSKRGNYVANHAAWLRWPRAQLYFFPDEDSTIAGIMNCPCYSVVIKTLPPNLRIAKVLPSSPYWQPDSMVIFKKARDVFDSDVKDVFVQFQDIGDNGQTFILAVRMQQNLSWRPNAKWQDTLTPYLFLPPSDNINVTLKDLQNVLRQESLRPKLSVPYYVEITTQTLSRSGLYMVDIIPKRRAKREGNKEIHNLKFWTGLLRRTLIRDSLVERVYEDWLDHLCDRGLRSLRLLALLSLFFAFPFDLILKVVVSLTTPVLSHIAFYTKCLTAASYENRLTSVVHEMSRTVMAHKFSIAAVVSASGLLLSNTAAMRKIFIWVLKYSRSKGVLKILLLYIICKCIPPRTLLSFAGEEEIYHED
ncbi:HET domain-containing protein [Aspergillus tubingensis]|uniref:HET domain-containing protein n=1 Tax=Aspergillus tubingensis TaxID=5068 RepID=UPI001577EED3|nr:HET domain-containing protein [Aspergillus tubingensis]GFN15327.1 HET domain-containing protein [Aspergillus tubingensis]